MANTKTSKPSLVTVGNQRVAVKTVVTDNGNNNFAIQVVRNSESTPNATGTVIAETDSSGKLKPTANASSQEKLDISNTNSQLIKEVRNQKSGLEAPLGVTDPTAKAAYNKAGGLGSGNQAINPEQNKSPESPVNDEAKKALFDESDTFREKTRLNYGDARYPLDLSIEFQDCIKFTILNYRPSLAGGKGGQGSTGEVSRIVTIDKGNPTIGKERLGTITLPIPAGISDSNSVSWQEDPINNFQKSLGDIAQKYIIGGTESAEPAIGAAGNKLQSSVDSGDLQRSLSATLAGYAAQTDKLQQRVYGTMFNNNLELLFNGPGLRTFSFVFKLSPRSPSEAKEVMKIIRYFKQAMSVKRSKSSILLKTPRTFAISYMSSNQQHPYLNKFKECALTSMNVDYTPDGQYMTYMSSNINERSMISYNLTLSFQELEPVFDDEYGNEQVITNIGY